MTDPNRSGWRWRLAAWLLGIRHDQMIVKSRFEEDSHQWQLQTFKVGYLKQIALLMEAEKQGFFSHLR
ncbi:hypothetical protein UFOVP510_5 [uncultured Caudovirales phage]|uniref:Uncharacterized protein n=1 Tax=uncultured Caudovirales phage TaxID=2100421 RepID=A0A6J5ML14_9CAUD|nr:hypothetical protein UFOVP510_5 [uncultured Caudovirales phage]